MVFPPRKIVSDEWREVIFSSPARTRSVIMALAIDRFKYQSFLPGVLCAASFFPL
jgi:hypothetical protein